jgi:peptidoglycan/LPS O-acetylase OafA/YrhL
MKKLIYLEWARGIAALLVVLHHATLDAPAFYNYKPFNNFFYFGMAGVDFFFVLSGFIIYYIHSNDNGTFISIKNYTLKRFIRIYPPFLFVSSIIFVAYLVNQNATERTELFDIEFLIKSFLLLPNPMPPLLTVSWTLIHEVFFYLLFIIIILNKQLGIFVFILWGGAISLLAIFDTPLNFPYSFYFNLHNLEFIFGLFVAYIFNNKTLDFFNKNINFIFIVSLTIFILNGINQDYKLINIDASIRLITYGLSSAVILLSIINFSNQFYKNKILSLLGLASYSIYLIHVPLLSILHRIISKFHIQAYIHPNLIFLIIVFLSVLGGILMYFFIEKPITNYLKNKLINKKL